MKNDPSIYTKVKAIECPRTIHDTSQQKKIHKLTIRFQHDYDVTNFKSKYSN